MNPTRQCPQCASPFVSPRGKRRFCTVVCRLAYFQARHESALRQCSRCKATQPRDQFMQRSTARKQPDSHCRACKREIHDAWAAVNKDKISSTDRTRRMRERRAVFQKYGLECACCREDRIEFLAIDHLHGGGGEHRRSLGIKGSSFYRWLIDQGFPPGYRTLCHNCNMALGFYGYCPHQRGWQVDDLRQRSFVLSCDDPQQSLL